MGRKRIYEEGRVQRSVYLSEEELSELQRQGISITKFFTQAHDAFNAGKWEYKHGQ